MKIVKTLFLLSLFFASLIVNAADTQPDVKLEQTAAQIRPIDKLKQELSLTDDQVKAIEEIQQQNRKNFMAARKADANSESSHFFDLTPDSKEYDEAVKKMADAASARARGNVEKMAETRKKVYGLLNAEQKQKFLTLTKPGQRPVIHPQRKGENPAVE